MQEAQDNSTAASTSSTPKLLNEAFTRLRASAAAYEHACGLKQLTALHEWMRSYGNRLRRMAEQLQDEGARSTAASQDSAKTLYDEDVCKSPSTILVEAEKNQQTLIDVFVRITDRLDMDAELFDLVNDQREELTDVLSDMAELRREYEAYGVQ